MGVGHMEERKILRQMAEILRVDIEDLPKTLRRFRKDIEEMGR